MTSRSLIHDNESELNGALNLFIQFAKMLTIIIKMFVMPITKRL